MYSAPHASIQILAFIRSGPCSSTATVPSHVAVQHTPITWSGAVAPRAIMRRVAVVIARHQSAGSCSTPPSSVRISSVGSYSVSTIAPAVLTSATFGPDVPRSIASTHSITSLASRHGSQRGFERNSEAVRGRARHFRVTRLHHDPHDGLGARCPHDHPAFGAERAFHRANLDP